MEFIVLRSGQVIHEEMMVPGAVPAAVGLPAVDGVGPDEHLVLKEVEGWKIEVPTLEALLQLVDSVEAEVIVRRPLDLYLNGKRAFVIDVTPGIGH